MDEKESILRLRNLIRIKHLSLSTERSYADYVGRYIRFIRNLPAGLTSEKKFERWLSDLAVNHNVSASTQNVAFNAVLFFYSNVLGKSLNKVDGLRAKRPVNYRNAHAIEDVLRLLEAVEDGFYPVRLILQILYERGLRLDEPLNFRFRDVDLRKGMFIVRQAKGFKYRVSPIPQTILPALMAQMKVAESIWQMDAQNKVSVQLPHQIARKYPNARFSPHWAWIFPQLKPCKDPRSGETVRWHVLADTVQRGCKRACQKTGLDIKPHELRHSFATDLLNNRVNIKLVAEAMGHKRIETTSGYDHTDVMSVPSPVDFLNRRNTTLFIPTLEPKRLELKQFS